MQVPKLYYFKNYDDKDRWMSYWHQIDCVLKTGGKKVLEVGIGNGLVSDHLRKMGLDVTTVDIDPDLNPDKICSVTQLSKIFELNSFDTILCAEVLEHMPFEYFEKALDELHAVSKSWVILSLPYHGLKVAVSLYLSKMGAKSICAKAPFPTRHKFDGHHYWEIGKRGFLPKRIVKILERKFTISERFVSPEDPYHLFFALRRR